MQMKIIAVCVIGLASRPATSQSVFPAGWTETAVMIQHSAGTGSGFFFQSSNKVFLVTAKHVIFDAAKFPSLVLLSTNATCMTWLEQTNVSRFTIDLAGSFAARETRGHPSRDVALVYCEEVATNGFHARAFFTSTTPGIPHIQLVLDRHTEFFKSVPVGSDIYTFGYPSSIGLQNAHQIDPSRPLVRRGTVADKDPNRRILVLDSPVFKGNSGGPVIERGDIQLAPAQVSWPYKIIGIAVEFVPFEERWVNNQFGYWNTTLSNSGYSIAEPMDSVLELVW